MKYAIASLVLAFVFLGTVPSNASVISDTFRYDNAPKHISVQRRHLRAAAVPRRLSTHVARYHTAYRPNTIGQRPSKWCGWWARQQKGVTNPSYNRAINWLNYGRPTSPQVGAVVVWSHHVGIITGRDSRGWLVTSGNWNNRVATVPLSQMGRGVQGYRI